MILLSILLFVSNNIFPGAMWDAVSFLIVNVCVCLLFITAFGIIKNSNKNYFYFKLVWMQEMMIILGLLGLGLGYTFMLSGMLVPAPPGVDPTSQLISGVAISLITVVYGFVGAVIFYLIQKYYEFKNYKYEAIEIFTPKEGLQFQSLIYFTIFVGIFLFSCYRAILSAGVQLKNIFTFEALIFFICINILFIFLYKGNYLDLLKNIFWYSQKSKNIIRYNIIFIRNMKKITSMVMTLILIIMPIVLLAAFSIGPQEMDFPENNDSFVYVHLNVLINILIYYVITTVMIIIMNVFEGREVSNLYILTGEISTGNRFYVITYILPPALLLYITLLITLVWTTL